MKEEVEDHHTCPSWHRSFECRKGAFAIEFGRAALTFKTNFFLFEFMHHSVVNSAIAWTTLYTSVGPEIQQREYKRCVSDPRTRCTIYRRVGVS